MAPRRSRDNSVWHPVGHMINHMMLKHHRPHIRGTCSSKSISPPDLDLPLTWSLAFYHFPWASHIAQLVKNLPAMQETWVRFLGWEDPWRRKWQPTPVFLPGEFHGQRSLVGYSPWGRKESDTTERLHFSLSTWWSLLCYVYPPHC